MDLEDCASDDGEVVVFEGGETDEASFLEGGEEGVGRVLCQDVVGATAVGQRSSVDGEEWKREWD